MASVDTSSALALLGLHEIGCKLAVAQQHVNKSDSACWTPEYKLGAVQYVREPGQADPVSAYTVALAREHKSA